MNMDDSAYKLLERTFPILEFDPHSKPIIEAKNLYDKSRNPRGITRCLITYFQDVVEKYERDDRINQVYRLRTEGVRPRVYEKEYRRADGKTEYIYVAPVPLGAPIAAPLPFDPSAAAVHCATSVPLA